MLDTARSPNVLSLARVAGSGAVLGAPAARRIGADCQGDAMPAAQVLPAVDGSRSADDSGVPLQRRDRLIDPREEGRALTTLILKTCRPVRVVGLAGSLGEAETQIRADHAHAALVEIQMPVTLGL